MSLIKFKDYTKQISEGMAVEVLGENDEDVVVVEWTEDNWKALSISERAELEAEAVNGWAVWQIGELIERKFDSSGIFEADKFLADLSEEECDVCGDDPCSCEIPDADNSDIPEAKKTKLPPHLAKFFDKDGNLKKDAADRIAKGKAKLNWKDVTPKGYGPSEDLEEAMKPMSKKGDYEFGKDTSKNISYVKYKGKVISTGDFDSGADAWFMNIKGEKGQKSFDKPSEVIAYFTKKKITEELTEEELVEYKARNTMQRRATQKNKDRQKFQNRAAKIKAKIERKKGGNKVKRIKLRKKWMRKNKTKIKNANKVFGGKVKSKFTKK